MEATPAKVNVAQLVRDMMRLPAVRDVHDLHVWSLADGMPVLTAHVQVTENCTLTTCEGIVGELNALLGQKYAIKHSTLQLECAGCATDDLYCTLPSSRDGEHAHGPPHPDHDHGDSKSRG